MVVVCRSQELVRHLQEERQRLLQTVEDLESRNATLAADKRKAELQLAEHKQDQNPAASAVGAGGASASSLAALNETLKLELEDLRRSDVFNFVVFEVILTIVMFHQGFGCPASGKPKYPSIAEGIPTKVRSRQGNASQVGNGKPAAQ